MPKSKIVVSEYQPVWAKQFIAFEEVFQCFLEDTMLSIEHIGSTSVPGLAAKPILDIDIVVANEAQQEEVIGRLEKLGYRHVGDQGVPGREAVKPVSDQVPLDGTGRTWPRHHLYICQQGVPSLQNHLHLRDYLREHPEQVIAYGELKKHLAARFPYDIDAYIQGKTEFILNILTASGMKPVELAVARAVNSSQLDQVQIRYLSVEDRDFFEEMFYTSLFVPPNEPPFSKSIIFKPGLLKYHQDWGRPSDLGLLLYAPEELIGAAWSRFFRREEKGYGFIDEDIPEIGIALRPKYRGNGLGTTLLKKLLEELRLRGVRAVSLSVDERNPALRLYERVGFKLDHQEEHAMVMINYL
ncbi:MAG: GrpB family protein [Saprospiraceae bacterium]|nr:GNAT family N-acetyltransferase [Lewinella sp.]